MRKRKDIPPPFNNQLGFLYPLVWRILASNRYWSPSMWLPRKSGVAIDMYLCGWWLIEIAIVFLHPINIWASWVCVGLLIYRIIDMGFALMSILLKGFYRRSGDWLSANRIVLLVVANTIELMFVFAILYRSCGSIAPNAGAITPGLESMFDSFYFSVVTATTLGYGIPHPVGWLSRTLSIAETLIIFLIVVTLVGYVASARGELTDLEKSNTNEGNYTGLQNK